MKNLIKKLISNTGYEIRKKTLESFDEYEKEFLDIYKECKPYTMTTIEPMYALYKSVEYIIKNHIPGDFIECGVWRGGSSMLIAKTLLKFNCTDRYIYLFDTFSGMSDPTEVDVNMKGIAASNLLNKYNPEDSNSIWCYATLAEVEANMKQTGYPGSYILFNKGKVEDTLPGFSLRNQLALIRLDTDWYESTKIEMECLFPKLANGGVLIIDDYGHWKGAKKAVDEYISENSIPILLNRVDYTVRIGIKTEVFPG
jgi:O-methyltransferase